MSCSVSPGGVVAAPPQPADGSADTDAGSTSTNSIAVVVVVSGDAVVSVSSSPLQALRTRAPAARRATRRLTPSGS